MPIKDQFSGDQFCVGGLYIENEINLSSEEVFNDDITNDDDDDDDYVNGPFNFKLSMLKPISRSIA